MPRRVCRQPAAQRRKFGAQAANVDVYRPLAPLEMDAPDQVEQPIPPEELAPVRDEKFQQIILAGCQR